ncbi:hypothetical protein A2U01_0058128, partial [Trifolium medium]|nr:hypothetical protein [Trifolium medium]
ALLEEKWKADNENGFVLCLPQSSKSRQCFDFANPSRGNFNQKPSPKEKNWIKINLIYQNKETRHSY